MDLLEYKCPNCGGAIGFDPAKQELLCPYCDSVISVEALKSMDEELQRAQENRPIDWGYEGEQWREGEQTGMVVYSCNSCSGEIIGDETLGATTCPFCGNAVVMTSKFAGTLRPDVVIPFKTSKKEALAALEKHYVGKRLLPRVFKDRNHLDEIKGVYVPFWLFDVDANAQIDYHATTVRFWSDSDYNYTETSAYRAYREGTIGFNRVPVDGSEAMDDTLMEAIEPFEMQEAVDFQTAYLAGYFANKYDVDAEQSVERANERIKNSTESAFAETVQGYDTVTARNTNIQLQSGGICYALLPVWLLGTSWQGNKYTFAMNGQTGKFVGDLPLDKAAYKSWFFKIFGITTAVLLAASQIIVTFL